MSGVASADGPAELVCCCTPALAATLAVGMALVHAIAVRRAAGG